MLFTVNYSKTHGVSWPSGLVHWTQVLVGSNPGLAGRGDCVLEHNCFVLRMGRKAVGPVCCVLCNARKRTQDAYREREGACPGVSGFAPWASSRVNMCALQIFCIIIIKNISQQLLHEIIFWKIGVWWFKTKLLVKLWNTLTKNICTGLKKKNFKDGVSYRCLARWLVNHDPWVG